MSEKTEKTLQQLWQEQVALFPGGLPADQMDCSRAAFFVGLMTACRLALESQRPMTQDFAQDLYSKVESQMAVEDLNHE